jgi:Holliday junction resolvase-like predicted endonuclease
MKKFTSKKQKLGLQGEHFAEMFLVKHGFTVIERNFTAKAGEIDIICKKDNRYHFIEVKTTTVPRETKRVTESVINTPKGLVSRETFIHEYRRILNPFQNISRSKIKKISKTVALYLESKKIDHAIRWQIDGIGIHLETENEYSVTYIENIAIH